MEMRMSEFIRFLYFFLRTMHFPLDITVITCYFVINIRDEPKQQTEMKAYIDIRRDKGEVRVNVIGGFDAKESLKDRGYRYEPQAILDHDTTHVVNGWRRELGYDDARSEVTWLASIGIECKQGVVY